MNTEMFRGNMPTADTSNAKFLDLDKIAVTAMRRAERDAAVYSPGFHTKMARVLGKVFPSAISVKFAGLSVFVPDE